MKRAVTPPLLVLSMILAAGSGTALAGVEPMPWHTVISNGSDRLDPASPFSNQAFYGMVLTVRAVVPSDVIGGTTEIEVVIPIKAATGEDLTLDPGATLAFAVDPASLGLSASAQFLSWSFFVKMGVEPTPWHAFETKLTTPPDPWLPPSLTPSYLTGEMPILGFASPGVVLGTVQLVSDELFYDACPSVPAPQTPWKNHGQYVRCIAHRAEALVAAERISQEEADVFVSAAAQSATGK